MQSRYDRIRILRNFLCGLLIGGGAILPGVSGGVLAVVFGVYHPCMEILVSPAKALPKYWRILLPLGLGVCIGFLLFAKGVAALFTVSAAVAVWLFIGLILGTMPQLFWEAGKEGRTFHSWLAFIVCFLVMLFLLVWFRGENTLAVTPNFGWYLFSGILFGVGTIVPGLTTSAILMALGLYEPVLAALTEFQIPVLAAIGVGVAVSVLLLARGVSWLFKRCYSVAFHGIIGVVAASTLAIVPLSYEGTVEILLSAACAVGGCCLAGLMAVLDTRER